MKFVSIPNNGASWREKLIYAIDTESDEAIDLNVDIIDSERGVVASLNIYQVKTTEIDIAPYLRTLVDESPTGNIEALTWSSAALEIRVAVNGVESQQRVFYRANLDVSTAKVLSRLPTHPTVSPGETLRMTIFSRKSVEIKLLMLSLVPEIKTYTLMTYGRPVEFTLPIAADANFKRLRVTIICDGVTLDGYDFMLIKSGSSARQVVWYNMAGGVESYTFPKSVRLNYRTDVAKATSGRVRIKGRYVTRELYSAYESPEELERIMQMVFAPQLYISTEQGCLPQSDFTRRVAFTPQGNISQLKIEIEEAWRGGEL